MLCIKCNTNKRKVKIMINYRRNLSDGETSEYNTKLFFPHIKQIDQQSVVASYMGTSLFNFFL